MKKYAWILLLVIILLSGVACSISGPNDISKVKPKPPGSVMAPPLEYKELPTDSEVVCSYAVEMRNGLSFWQPAESYSAKNAKEARVGTKFLVKGTLSAAPGWSWTYQPAGLSGQEGHYCKSVK